MKIALIVTDYDSEAGVPKFTRALAERFCINHDTHVFSNSYSKHINKNIKFHKIPVLSKNPFFKTLSSAISATLYCKKNNFDIVLSPAGQAFRCDIASAHGCYRIWREIQRNEGTLKHKFDPVGQLVNELERQVYNNSKQIVAVSSWMRKEILKYYDVDSKKVVVINNGVDINKYKFNKEKRDELRKKYNIKTNELVIVFSAREFKRKGLKYIIDALPLLKQKYKLIVIGKANGFLYKTQADRLGIRDKIIFTGYVDRIENYYSSGDLFVLPSFHEEFPSVILEALASSLPVLITNVGGAKDVITNGKNGFIIRRNSKDIANKINSITFRKLSKMKKEARKSILGYSLDAVAKRYLELFEEVVRNEKSR